MPTVHLLDYVAGNVRSLVNAINKVGYEVEWVRSPSDLKNAEVSAQFSYLCTNISTDLWYNRNSFCLALAISATVFRS